MVLDPSVDPTEEPRDSSVRPGPPESADHEDLKRAAESAIRLAATLGEVAFTVAGKGAKVSADLAITTAGKTAKAVAKWMLI